MNVFQIARIVYAHVYTNVNTQAKTCRPYTHTHAHMLYTHTNTPSRTSIQVSKKLLYVIIFENAAVELQQYMFSVAVSNIWRRSLVTITIRVFCPAARNAID